MALTPDEFFQSVALVMQDLAYRVEGLSVTAGTPERGLVITLRPLPPRRLSGLLSLPHTEVRIAFTGYGAAEQAAFLERFDRAYQRGGG